MMLTQLILHQNDAVWNRFVGPDINPDYVNPSTYPVSTSNIYIQETSFIDLQNSVITVENSEYNHILISKSFFSNLNHDNSGSISVSGGDCILYRVCSMITKCKNSNACHSYVDTEKNNHIIESSISKCSGDDCSICLKHGNQLIEYTNISYANCVQNAAYTCENPSDHQINYTSIYNNTAQNKCIMLHSGNKQYVDNCNIMKNKVIPDDNNNQKCIVYYDNCESLYIKFSVFSYNSGLYLFINHADNEWNDFQLRYCTIVPNDANLSTGQTVYKNADTRLPFNIPHLITQKCYAEFPLDPIEKVNEASIMPNPYQNPAKMNKRQMI